MSQQNRWAEMFPCIIARTSTTEVISNGINGTRNGALQIVSLVYFLASFFFFFCFLVKGNEVRFWFLTL